jgi:hypothetical protein
MTDIEDKDIRPAEICGGAARIEGLRYINCRIIGPAVLAIPHDYSVRIEGRTQSVEPIAAIFRVTEDPFIGAVALKNVVFRDCQFRNVGFIGSERAIGALRRAVGPEGVG